MKVQAERAYKIVNGHIIGFRPQTQKLELPHKTLSNTLAVKGLIMGPLKDNTDVFNTGMFTCNKEFFSP